MPENKDQIIKKIAEESRRRVADLSKQFARTTSQNKESIMAEMEFKKELADICELCLAQPE